MATTEAYHKYKTDELLYGSGCSFSASCFECEQTDCVASVTNIKNTKTKPEQKEKPKRLLTIVREYNKTHILKPEEKIVIGIWTDDNCDHKRTEATSIQPSGYVTETCKLCGATRKMPGIMSLINTMFAQGSLKQRHGVKETFGSNLEIHKPTRGKVERCYGSRG